MKKIIALIAAAIFIASVLTVPASAAKAPYTEFFTASDLKLDGSSVAKETFDGSIHEKVLSGKTGADDANGEGFTLEFTVPESGQYVVWGRIYFPTYKNNSLFYAIDGGQSTIWDFPDEDDDVPCNGSWQYFYLTTRVTGTYTDTKEYGWWTIENGDWRHKPVVFELSAGKHSIHFCARETGWYIDEFVVTALGIAEYDPNACEGNTAIYECKFCGTDHKHYYKDSYAAKGVLASEYFKTLYPEEEEKPADDKPAGGAEGSDAPETGDPFAAVAVIASAALLGAIAVKKTRRG